MVLVASTVDTAIFGLVYGGMVAGCVVIPLLLVRFKSFKDRVQNVVSTCMGAAAVSGYFVNYMLNFFHVEVTLIYVMIVTWPSMAVGAIILAVTGGWRWRMDGFCVAGFVLGTMAVYLTSPVVYLIIMGFS